MINLKTVLLFLVIIASCYCQNNHIYHYKKKKHHHGLHHIKFLHYLIFLAIKLKLVVFFGTIFTISFVAAKIFGLIKLTEYMKQKYHHHETEKIVYVNPHEHYDHHDYGGYSGGYSGGFTSPGDFSSKIYPGSDIALDHPPSDHERYATTFNSGQYANSKISSRNYEGSYSSGIYNGILQIANKLRRLNITDRAFNEMGIKDDNCKKKFVCLANYNAEGNTFLQTGIDILSDDSYQKYKPNATITSEEDCVSLYKECDDHVD